MGLLLVPEFILLDTLQKAILAIRKDYNESSNPDQSWIGILLKDIGYERYEFLKQASQVFIVDEKDPRHLQVDLGFNMTREGAPGIHITMPSESPGQNAIGNDEGYQEPVFNSTGNEYNKVFTRRYKSTYDIVVTSDNSNECLLIYHVIKAILVALTIQLNIKGLQNITFSGQDLQPYADLMPKNMFVRAIRLGIEYESSTLTFEKYPTIVGIIFEGEVVSD